MYPWRWKKSNMGINQAISLRSIAVLSNLVSTFRLSNSTASFDHSYIPLVTSPQVKQLFFNGVYSQCWQNYWKKIRKESLPKDLIVIWNFLSMPFIKHSKNLAEIDDFNRTRNNGRKNRVNESGRRVSKIKEKGWTCNILPKKIPMLSRIATPLMFARVYGWS